MATDYEKLRTMKDEDIDCSDIPALTDDELADMEGLWITPGTEYIHLALDTNAVDYFRKNGKGYVMRISRLVNSFLKNYMDTHPQPEGAV